MAGDLIIQIADAMVQELNWIQTQTPDAFSRPFNAERLYDYTRDLEDTVTLRVDVVPETHEDEPLTRQAWRGPAIVSIAVREKFNVNDTARADALTLFTGELRDFWTTPPRALMYMPAAKILKRKIVYPYLQKQFRTHGQFVSVLQLTFNLVSQ
jgi:hypothetical protein